MILEIDNHFQSCQNGNTTICFIRLQLYCYNLPRVVFYKHIIYTAVKKTLLLRSGLSLPVNTTEETSITINQVFRLKNLCYKYLSADIRPHLNSPKAAIIVSFTVCLGFLIRVFTFSNITEMFIPNFPSIQSLT